MRRLLLLAFMLLLPSAALSETCTLTGTGTLSYTAPTTLAYSGTTAGCTITLDDAISITTGTVTIGNNVGQGANPLTGGITVGSAGTLTISPGATLFETGVVEYQSGSHGTLNGSVMTVAAPRTITFPSATTITFDFAGCAKMNRSTLTKCTWPGSTGANTLWTLCSSASSCGSNTIHAATTNEAATLVYVDWEKTTPPQNRFIGANGRVADTEPVYDPGLYLEVTSVDTTNNTVTVTLPDVGTNGAAYWYKVAEALSGTGLKNIVTGTGWTVSGAGAYTNNENKLRYEIQIDTADTPFDTDHEFEGYLICRRLGGYCARIIKTEVDSHDAAGTAIGTGESVVVWNDPTGIVAAGDEMDVYYAKPTPSDSLVFVNPVKFTFTRSGATAGGSLYVDLGANVATTASPSSGVWVYGGWGGGRGAPGAERGSVDFGNETLGVNIDLWLVERQDGCQISTACASDAVPTALDGAAVHSYTADGMTIGSDTAGVGVSNILAKRVTIRFPQVAQNSWDNGSSFKASPSALNPVERTGGDRNVTAWSNNALRKVRLEGYGYALSGARMGIQRNCKDGMWIQDMLLLHGRSGRPLTTAARGDDTFEYQAAGASCDVDRVVSVASNAAGAFVGRSMREAQTYYTSIIGIGGPGRISRTYPGTADQTTYWSGDVLYFQGEDGGAQAPYYSRGYLNLVNWVTDGKMSGVHNAYGMWSDWYVEQTSVPSSHSCEDTIGFYVVGGFAGYGKLGDSASASTGSCRSSDNVRWIDVYMAALGAENNFQKLAAGTGLIDISKSVAPNSLTLDGWLFASKNAPNTTSPLRSISAAAGWVLPTLWYKNFTGATLATNTAYMFLAAAPASVPNISAFKATNVFWGQPNGNVLQVYVGGALSLTTCQSGGGGVNICSSAAGENEVYYGINSYLGMSGDFTTGLGLTPMTWSVNESGTDDVRNAAPRYAGIIVYDWPFSWATMNPVPGYRRTTPRSEFIPARLRHRMAGSERTGWVPVQF